MITQHDCWWTRRHESELRDHGASIAGAGIPPEVLKHAASLLATDLAVRMSETDPYEKRIELARLAMGATHDDCFFYLEPASPELKKALLDSLLDLHSTYLGVTVDWSRIRQALQDYFTPGTVMRLRSITKNQRFTFRLYPLGATFLDRVLARSYTVDCRDGVARFP